MTLSVHALTTVERLRIYNLGRDEIPPVQDLLLESLIEAISRQVERHVGYHLEKRTTADETHSGGGQFLKVRNRPVITVTTVKENDSALAAADYVWDREEFKERGLVYRESGWPAARVGARGTLDFIPVDWRVAYPYKVTYDAGYVLPSNPGVSANPPTATISLEPDIELACWRLLMATYQHRDKEGVTSISLEGVTLTFDRWPKDVKELLAPYRILAVA